LLPEIADDPPPPQKKMQINWGKPGPFCNKMHKAIQNRFNIGEDRLDNNRECISNHAIHAHCVGIPCKTFYKYIHPDEKSVLFLVMAHVVKPSYLPTTKLSSPVRFLPIKTAQMTAYQERRQKM
jgi:hypothetical protein